MTYSHVSSSSTSSSSPLTSPASKESEMMVLGCMLTNINALNIAADQLHEEDLYYSEHRIIFSVLQKAYQEDSLTDIHLAAEELKRQNKLQAAGGIEYLTTLAQFAGTYAHIEEYVLLVRNKAILRRMIQAAQQIEKDAANQPEDVVTALDIAQQRFYQIGLRAKTHSGVLLKEVLSGTASESGMPFIQELQQRQETYQQRGPNDQGVTGIPTRFIELDKMINGLGRSNLIILAARPAMGKTALAVNIAENVCFQGGMPVGIFSLEMSAGQLVQRLISSQAEVPSSKIQTGSLDGMEFQQILETVNRIQDYPLMIDDQPGISVTDLRTRARRMKEVYGIELLIIDYLQLLSGSGSIRSQENRQNEISEISRILKNLSRELHIPVICLSQLSRKVEERVNKRPVLSDLRESGSIEQDADVILFLLRSDYYDPKIRPGLSDVIVAKNRHGSIGDVPLVYRKDIVQFVNYTSSKGTEAF